MDPRTQDRIPFEGRDRVPFEGRDRVPFEGRDRVPFEGRDRVPFEGRDKVGLLLGSGNDRFRFLWHRILGGERFT
jgi:hypothetical protein